MNSETSYWSYGGEPERDETERKDGFWKGLAVGVIATIIIVIIVAVLR